MGRYWRPRELDAALRHLAEAQPVILAGGTWRVREPGDAARDILDLSAIPALRGITHGAEGWRIGAATPWVEVLEAALPLAFAALKQAGGYVGGPQIRNRGTIGGNILAGNKSSDGFPALLALGASLDLAGPAGRRRVPLTTLSDGPVLAPEELLAAIHLPEPPPGTRSHYLKLGFRESVNVGVVSVGVSLTLEAGCVAAVRCAIGACLPVARRLPAAEEALLGQAPDPALLRPEHLAGLPLRPDWTAPNDYRLEAALAMLRRCVAEAAR